MSQYSTIDPANLLPQPEIRTPVVRDPVKAMREEVEANRIRLEYTRNMMVEMKDEIKKCTDVLQKELGKDVDIPALVRTQSGKGPLERTQEIINLRLRLSALRSQFVEPVHKIYYRGPFAPHKKFDVNVVPKKQPSLYSQMLDNEKKTRLLNQDKPQDTLKDEMREMSLMYRASCAREKSLKKKIRETRVRFEKIKADTAHRVKVIGYMIGHQSLMKMMLDPATMSLDGNLSDYKSACATKLKSNELVPGGYKFKTFYDMTEKDVKDYQDKLLSLAEMLDSTTERFVKAEGLCIQTRCQFERSGDPELPPVDAKKPSKQVLQGDAEEPEELTPSEGLALMKEENGRIREFLLSPFVSIRDDFKLFLLTLAMAKTEFCNSIDDVKLSFCTDNEDAF